MKTTILFFMAALALMTAACSNDDNELTPAEQPAKAEGITITAKLAPKSGGAATHAVADNGDNKITVTWAKTEHLAILYTVGSDKKVADAEITDVDATTGEATISFGVDGSTVDGTACQIVYPLAAAKDDKTGVKDAATLLAAQDGTLNTNLDVRVGNGTIHTSPASLDVTTQPAAQFAIFKFTVKDYAGTADVSVRPLKITIGTQEYVITPTAATNELYAALPAVSSQKVTFIAKGSDSKTYWVSKPSVTFVAGKYYQSGIKMSQVTYTSATIGVGTVFHVGDTYYADGTTKSFRAQGTLFSFINSNGVITLINDGGTYKFQRGSNDSKVDLGISVTGNSDGVYIESGSGTSGSRFEIAVHTN